LAAEKRELKASYVAGDSDLMALAQWPWPSADVSDLIAARAAIETPRQVLVDTLLLQNAGLPDADAVRANILALADPHCFTITTGHQVCLMGGPMFTLYKIATTIAMARDWASRHPQNRFVPVLWMATEDHDWEEVNHFFARFGEKTTYPGKFEGPVGRHILEPSIAEILPTDLDATLRSFYAPGTSMATAFRGLMHHLFGSYGLVIVDADSPALKQAFAPAMMRELRGAGMAQALRATSQTLEEMGFKAQIYPRDINLFYIGDGGRRLIDRTDEGYRLKDGGQSWTEADMMAELEAHPENFSPNVALRPVYQETVLPNLAYIGGWAEVSYWLQLRSGFAVHETPYPMVVPRLHATLFTAEQAAEWEALGLPLPAITQALHLLNDEYLAAHWDEAPLEASITAVDAAFMQLASLVEAIDPTQATGIRAEQARSDNAFDNLRKKLKKSIRNRNPQPYQAIATLKNVIEPENAPQQRTLNFTAFNSVDPLNLVKIIVEQAAWNQSEAKWIILK
jgi:bacillithiol synthase